MKVHKTRSEFTPGRGYSKAEWDNDGDPRVTPAQAAQARPFAEACPELAESIRRGRGKQKAPTKVRVTLRLDRATVEAFKATGAGWQTRLGAALKRIAPG